MCIRDSSDRHDPSFEISNEPHLLTQGDLNDLVRDLHLSKNQAELLGSQLKGWNLLDRGTKVCYFRNRQEDLKNFFSQEGDFEYCNYILSVMDTLGPVSYTHLDVYKRQQQCFVYDFD